MISALCFLAIAAHLSGQEIGLAVLPFENAGAGTEAEWLSAGISESLSTAYRIGAGV